DHYLIDALRSQLGSLNDGAGIWRYSKSIAFQPELVIGMAPSNGSNCSNCSMLRALLLFIYETRDSVVESVFLILVVFHFIFLVLLWFKFGADNIMLELLSVFSVFAYYIN